MSSTYSVTEFKADYKQYINPSQTFTFQKNNLLTNTATVKDALFNAPLGAALRTGEFALGAAVLGGMTAGAGAVYGLVNYVVNAVLETPLNCALRALFGKHPELTVRKKAVLELVVKTITLVASLALTALLVSSLGITPSFAATFLLGLKIAAIITAVKMGTLAYSFFKNGPVLSPRQFIARMLVAPVATPKPDLRPTTPVSEADEDTVHVNLPLSRRGSEGSSGDEGEGQLRTKAGRLQNNASGFLNNAKSLNAKVKGK